MPTLRPRGRVSQLTPTPGWVVAAACMAAIVAGTLRGDAWTWGVHALAFLPVWFRVVCFTGLAVVLVPGAGRRLGEGLARFGERAVPSPAFGALTALGIGTMCAMLRPEMQFLGDGAVWQSKLARGMDVTHYDPAAAAIVAHVSAWISPTAPQTAAGIPSIGLGVIYAFTVWMIARRMSTPIGRGTAWSMLICSPTMLFFFRYVDSNPFAFVVQSLLILLLLSRRGGVLAVIGAMGAGIAIHLSSIAWLPALWARCWQADRPGNLLQRCTRTFAATLGVFAVAWALIWATGHSPTMLVRTLVQDSAVRENPAGWMFSRAHLADLANEALLLLLPAIALTRFPPPGGWRRLAPEWRTVLWLVPGQLAMLLLVRPLLGGARDWDLFAGIALPMLLCAAGLFDANVAEAAAIAPSRSVPARHAAVAGRAVALALVIAVSYLWVNLDSSRAAERLVAVQSPNGPMSPAARGMANELLAVFYHGRDRGAARDAWRRAAEAAPTSVRYLKGWALAERRRGDLDASLAVWRRVGALSPDDPDAVNALREATGGPKSP